MDASTVVDASVGVGPTYDFSEKSVMNRYTTRQEWNAQRELEHRERNAS